eukprot:TRINITY_DN2329_c0_g2_i2.p1 TRINITY_DN2329_c0_g2~~TRINITY_DN2329_c0_g2_i2.p1  ORF type:complete len:187 (-),score=34.32 TRINITY_DN2329_c0_g2_i2:237-797(-)
MRNLANLDIWAINQRMRLKKLKSISMEHIWIRVKQQLILHILKTVNLSREHGPDTQKYHQHMGKHINHRVGWWRKKRERGTKSAAIIEEIEKKKAKYKEFLDYIAKKRTPKQSWNDVFNNFVSRKEKEKRSKSNAEEIAIKKEEAVAAPQRKARKVQKEKRKVLWIKKRLFVMNLPHQITDDEFAL